MSDISWNQVGLDISGINISGSAIGDKFGWSVAMSHDGNTVVIGGYEFNDGRGHVSVYDWDGTSWNKRGGDINATTKDDLGKSVSINGDGNIIAIGAPAHNSNTGYARVYEYNSATDSWDQLGSDITIGVSHIYFGHAVSLNTAGDRLAVGANYYTGYKGAVITYDWNSATENWDKMQTIIGSSYDYFGTSVSLNGVGDVLAAGAIQTNKTNNTGRGYCKIYEWDGSQWAQRGDTQLGENNGDHFGISVSLNEDGDRVAIGGYLNDDGGTRAGHTKILNWNSANQTWEPLGSNINGDNTRGDNYGDYSGYSVALNGDGDIVAIGHPRAQDGGSFSGKVVVYQYIDASSNWYKIGDQDSMFGQYAELAGQSVALSLDGTTVIVGAAEGSSPGKTRVFSTNTQSNSNICFIASTPIRTDQGVEQISKLIAGYHTVDGKPIKAITETVTKDKYLYKLKRNAFSRNVPSRDTVISGNHFVEYDGIMIPAKYLSSLKKVEQVEYKGEKLYNILMDKHEIIQVNNMNVETLHPDNLIAKLYTNKTFKEMKGMERNIFINKFNKRVSEKNLIKYN